MATETQVKNYLAYWFQLGKKVVSASSNSVLQPSAVVQGDRFSSEFEECWERLLTDSPKCQYVLEGTHQTIQDLLSSDWDIITCARCDMPTPMPEVVTNLINCPCEDSEGWPNLELPHPRLPVNSHHQLAGIKGRLETNRDPETGSRINKATTQSDKHSV